MFQIVVVDPACVEKLQKECGSKDVQYYWMSETAPSVKATQIICDVSQVMDFALNRSAMSRDEHQEEVYYADVEDVKELVGKIQQQYKLFYKLKDTVSGQFRIVSGKNGMIAYRKEDAPDANMEFDIIGAESNMLSIRTNYIPNITKNFVYFSKFNGISQVLNSSTGITINLNNIFVCTDE